MKRRSSKLWVLILSATALAALISLFTWESTTPHRLLWSTPTAVGQFWAIIITVIVSVCTGVITYHVSNVRSAVQPLSASTVWVGSFAVVAVFLALPGFTVCQKHGFNLIGGIVDSLALFVVSFSNYWEGGRCGASVPLGVQLSRLFASMALVSSIGILISTMSTNAISLWKLRRAEQVIIVVGVDDDSTPYMGQLIRFVKERGSKTEIAIFTLDPHRPCIEELHFAGARIITVDINSYEELAKTVNRHWKIFQVYLLSSDQARNKTRYKYFLTLMKRSGDAVDKSDPIDMAVSVSEADSHDPRIPLNIPSRIVVRIDESWHAEMWKRTHLGDKDIAVDVIGIYDSTAEQILRPLCDPAGVAANDCPTKENPVSRSDLLDLNHVIICGSTPLTTSLLSWLAQAVREARLVNRVEETIQVSLFADDGEDIIADHTRRQLHFGGDPLDLRIGGPEATTEAIEEILKKFKTSPDVPAVILTEDPRINATVLGPRIAIRHPDIRVIQYSQSLDGPWSDDSGQYFRRFGLFLGVPPGQAPQQMETWYRMAQLLHACYLRGQWSNILESLDDPSTRRPSQHPWVHLPELYRQDNLRAGLVTLSGIRALRWTWAPNNPTTRVPIDIDLWDSSVDLSEKIAKFQKAYGLSPKDLEWLAKRESESWVRLREQANPAWSFAAPPATDEPSSDLIVKRARAQMESDPRNPRHPAMKPWTELDEDYKTATILTVMQTVIQLAHLGYFAEEDS